LTRCDIVYFMRVWTILGYIGTTLAVIAVSGYAYAVIDYNSKPHNVAASNSTPQSVEPKLLNQEVIFNETNKRRVDAGIKPLAYHNELNNSAMDKADDMAERNYYSHRSPDGVMGYSLIFDYIPESNLIYASENIAMYCPDWDEKRLVDGWMSSKFHREAILDPRYDAMGVGVSLSPHKDANKECTGYAVQHFADYP
jgi:uncharacterized protein YkwD